ncbi:MAG TPA: RES family NAD+ phosphorylase [Chthoniobacterales bacterium]|nr:RES family NAD+ phosphorylase [Chthoniobacterales bacterium]
MLARVTNVMPPSLNRIRLRDTHRLIPSRFPPVGVLDVVASPEDLDAIFELEGWTNDRISAELGILQRIPKEEWVLGVPQATVIMATFCHPRPSGGRFNSGQRGAWYAGFELDTAHAEVVYHRTKELAEVGVYETWVEMRLYLADFSDEFHDIRAVDPEFSKYHDPDSYVDSQKLAESLFAARSNGILYRSVRQPGGNCISCFRPRLVANVRSSAHFEYRWEGTPTPKISRLGA